MTWLVGVFVVGLVAELTVFDASVGEALTNVTLALGLIAVMMLVIATIRRRSGDTRADAIGALMAVGLVTLALLLTLVG